MDSDVIILSRTKMANNNICVGGFDIKNRKMIRLLDNRACALTSDFPYKVGEIYTVRYENRYQLVKPHVEDVAVYAYKLNSSFNKKNLDTFVHSNCYDVKNLSELFSQTLHWNNYKGYALASNPPNFSVQIAKLKINLVKSGADFQEASFFPLRKVKYVGESSINSLPQIIPAGTPIRFSLARPWDKNGDGIKLCYLQLSGIYL